MKRTTRLLPPGKKRRGKEFKVSTTNERAVGRTSGWRTRKELWGGLSALFFSKREEVSKALFDERERKRDFDTLNVFPYLNPKLTFQKKRKEEEEEGGWSKKSLTQKQSMYRVAPFLLYSINTLTQSLNHLTHNFKHALNNSMAVLRPRRVFYTFLLYY